MVTNVIAWLERNAMEDSLHSFSTRSKRANSGSEEQACSLCGDPHAHRSWCPQR